MSLERQIEEQLIDKLQSLKYEYRPDICDRDGLVKNFREKYPALNRVQLGNSEFERLLEEIITPDVFAAAKTLRKRNSFTRDDATPLNYTLVNIKDWCKNMFEVVNQLRINTDNSHQRYDVILLINGVPVVQIELKSLGISPRRAMEQIVDYKNDPGNGYTKTLLCFLQLFIVSNRSDTWYFANNSSRHFSFNADERFLPVYQFAAEDNKKITHLHSFAEAFLPKCTLGQMISRYMVLIASEQNLMMMRPYPWLSLPGSRAPISSWTKFRTRSSIIRSRTGPNTRRLFHNYSSNRNALCVGLLGDSNENATRKSRPFFTLSLGTGNWCS
jgi:type I restriction enzyme R subunit